MPNHVTDNHFNINEVVEVGGNPYVNGESVVWLDSDDSLYKRFRMDKGALVLQYWDGSQFKDV